MQKWYISVVVVVCARMWCPCISYRCTVSRIRYTVYDVYLNPYSMYVRLCVCVRECDGPFCARAKKILCGPCRRCVGNGYGVYGCHRCHHHHATTLMPAMMPTSIIVVGFAFSSFNSFRLCICICITIKCMPGCVFLAFFRCGNGCKWWMHTRGGIVLSGDPQ